MNDARNEAAISAKSSAMSSDLLDFAEWRAFLCAPELRVMEGAKLVKDSARSKVTQRIFPPPQPRP